MKKSNKVIRKRKEITKAIRLTWGSLESHLDWSIKRPTRAEMETGSGSRRFHVETMKEYLRIIQTLLNQL